MARPRFESARGQTLVVFALVLTFVIIPMVGLVVDGGYAFGQRRAAQNVADFAALAGTGVVASSLTGGGQVDSDVVNAVKAAVAANGAQLSNYQAHYVTQEGGDLGAIGSGSIPSTAQGVEVNATVAWRPFFLGTLGITKWTAGANAVAYTPGLNVGNGVVPFGVNLATVLAGPVCTGDVAGCSLLNLSPGTLNLPGGFAWLKFGCQGPDANGKGFGLGQIPPDSNGGCANSKPFLGTEWGGLPSTSGDTFGCCTSVTASTAAGYGNDIGSLPGNKASVNDSQTSINYLETHDVYSFAPVWDYANGNGSNGYYHIVGYALFQIVHIKGGKTIQGVLRSSTVYDVPNLALSNAFSGVVQLTR